MPSVISAGTTAGTAITVSGDTTGNLAFQTQAGANTITVPNITGTLITTASTFAGTGPTFSAIQNAATALSAGANTKVNFQDEQWDTNNNYNTSTSRFTPTVAGYYQISSTVRADIANNGVLHIYFRKNGADEYVGNFISATSSQCATSGSCLIYLNGSTDYVEIAVFSASAGNTFTGIQSSFQGCLVRAA